MSDQAAGPDGSALSDQLGAWVCPWGICQHSEAQKCRANMETRHDKSGCGTRFPAGATLEQAKLLIAPRIVPSLLAAASAWCEYLDGPGDGADDSALEQRLMQDLRDAVRHASGA